MFKTLTSLESGLLKPSIAALVLGIAIITTPTYATAEEHNTSFSFSETLQASMDSLAEARDSLRSEISAALEGLTRDEARTAREGFAEDVQALRDESRALRDEARAELSAAGVTPADRDEGARGGGDRGGATDAGNDGQGRGGRGGQGGDAGQGAGGAGGRGGDR